MAKENENNWLNNTETITEPAITFAELKAEYEKGFQAGIDFAIEQMNRDVDLEPFKVGYVCLACDKFEFLTDAEAEKSGWASNACGECVANGKFLEMTDTAKPAEVVDIRKTPYFQRNLAPARKSERIGGIKVA